MQSLWNALTLRRGSSSSYPTNTEETNESTTPINNDSNNTEQTSNNDTYCKIETLNSMRDKSLKSSSDNTPLSSSSNDNDPNSLYSKIESSQLVKTSEVKKTPETRRKTLKQSDSEVQIPVQKQEVVEEVNYAPIREERRHFTSEGATDQEILKEWLVSIDLAYLYQVFLSKNVSFESIKNNGLSETDLNDLNIEKEIHKTKLMKASRKLKKSNGDFKVKATSADFIDFSNIKLKNIVYEHKEKKRSSTSLESKDLKIESKGFKYAEGIYLGYSIKITKLTLSSPNVNFKDCVKKLRKFTVHPNVIRFMGSLINFSDKSKKKSSKSLEHFLVWEFADVETLDSILKRRSQDVKGEQLLLGNEKQSIKVLLGISAGMSHLHSRGIFHGNLTPTSILVYEDFSIKIKDYENGAFTEMEGSPKKRDVLQFGTIMSNVFNCGNDQVNCNQKIKNLLTSCTQESSKNRPNFSEIFLMLTDIYNNLSSVKGKRFDSEKETSEKIKNEMKEKTEIIISLTEALEKRSTEINQLNSEIEKFKTPIRKISDSFGKEMSIPWSNFVTNFVSNFEGSNEEIAQKFKSILAKHGSVSKKSWQDFADWFLPYSNANAHHYIQEIADIVGANWFYGFITPFDAEDLLMSKSEGTFLIRFSTNPGCYALSVNYGRVGHWRIVVEEIGSERPYIKIDDRIYKDLNNIIETHRSGGEPLEIKKPTPKQCWLTSPADKFSSGHDDIYYGTLL